MAQNSQPADSPPSAGADLASTPAGTRGGSGFGIIMLAAVVFFLWQNPSGPEVPNLEGRLTVMHERVMAARERERVLKARVDALEQRLDSLLATRAPAEPGGARDPVRR